MLDIGTIGFDHPRWSPGFYDADLPAEWRFLHYCNQFRALLLPLDEALADATLRPELVEDSDDGFRFVVRIELDSLLGPGVALPVLLGPLGARLAALNLVVAEPVPTAVSGMLAELSQYAPLCIDGVAGPPTGAVVESVRRYCRAAVTWRPEAALAPDRDGDYLVALPSSQRLDRMRGVLEAAADWAGAGRGAGVFLEDPGAAPDGARETRILAELLGV